MLLLLLFLKLSEDLNIFVGGKGMNEFDENHILFTKFDSSVTYQATRTIDGIVGSNS